MAQTTRAAGRPARTALRAVSSTSALSLAAVLNALISWYAFVLVMRTSGLEAAGVAGLVQALIVFCFYFTNLALRQEILRGRHAQEDYRDLLALRALASLAPLLPLTLVLALVEDARAHLGAAALVFVVKLFEALFDIRIGFLQVGGRYARILTEAAIRLVAVAAVATAVVWATGSIGAAALAGAATFSAVFVGVTLADDLRPQRLRAPRRFGAFVAQVVRNGALLGAASAATAASTLVMRLVVERAGGLETVGALTAAYQFVVLAGIVQAAIAQLVLQKATAQLTAGRAAGGWLVFAIVAGMALGLVGAAFFQLFGAWIMTLVFGPELASFAWLLRDLFLAHAVVFAMALVAALVHALGAKRALLAGALVYTALCGAVAWAAYPLIGLSAAPLAYAVASATALAWFARVVMRGRAG